MVSRGFGIDFRVNNLFLDTAKLERTVGRETGKRLARLGGYLRRSASNRIKRRKGPSKPGNSPHAHAPGGSGLKAVRFKLDAISRELVVGIIKYTSRQNRPAPNVHEFGGVVTQAGSKANGQYRLPAGYTYDARRNLIRDAKGKFVTRAEAELLRADARRRQQWIYPRHRVQLNGRRFYPKRPTMKPTLDDAIRRGVVPQYFRGMLGS